MYDYPLSSYLAVLADSDLFASLALYLAVGSYSHPLRGTLLAGLFASLMFLAVLIDVAYRACLRPTASKPR